MIHSQANSTHQGLHNQRMQHMPVTGTAAAAAATTTAAVAVLLSSPDHPLTCFCPAPRHICCACSLCSKHGSHTSKASQAGGLCAIRWQASVDRVPSRTAATSTDAASALCQPNCSVTATLSSPLLLHIKQYTSQQACPATYPTVQHPLSQAQPTPAHPPAAW